jgi:hypothetical protein
MEKQDARQHLLQEAICWQHNASKHYALARKQRDWYLDGLAGNLMQYEYQMKLAQSFQYQSMVILIALI